jgi:hypothetical protein
VPTEGAPFLCVAPGVVEELLASWPTATP